MADLGKKREVVRIAGPTIRHRDGELQRARFADIASGKSAAAYFGRRAVVELAGDAQDEALGVRRIRPVMAARGLWLVESTRGEDGLALAERLQRAPEFGRLVRQALPDLYFSRTLHATPPSTKPNDPRYSGQWYLERIGIEAAWQISRGSKDVTVVVIDNGCDLQHPDLVKKLDPGRDVVDGDDDPSFAPGVEGNNHGTACAGLIAAETNNDLGIAGVCPECRLRCVRLLPDTPAGLVPISADMEAFDFALQQDAAVVSNSWGFTEAIPVPEMLKAAITAVHTDGRGGLGALVVFAAGNDDRLLLDDELNAVPGVITVGAVNNFGEVAQFSNYGPSVAVVAPLGTLSTDISGADGQDPTDYTSLFGGTSSACPIVAGVMALMVATAPTKTAAELEMVLKSTAKQSIFATPDGTGHDDYYGFGQVDPAKALAAIAPPPPKKKHGCSATGTAPDSMLAWLAILALGVVRRARADGRSTRLPTHARPESGYRRCGGMP